MVLLDDRLPACYGERPEHRVHHKRVPLRPASGIQDLKRPPWRNRFAIRPVADHRVKRIRDGYDARFERNALARDAVGVASPSQRSW